MSEINIIDWSPPAFFLKDACPVTFSEMTRCLQELGKVDLVEQLTRVLIGSQQLAGCSEEFSFMAGPVPRLTLEQRYAMDLQEEERVDLKIENGIIRIDLDNFRQINWFYVTNLPHVYAEIKGMMDQFQAKSLTFNLLQDK